MYPDNLILLGKNYIIHLNKIYDRLERLIYMANKITLDIFNAQNKNYHIYKISHSELAESHHYHDYYQVCYVSCGEIMHCQEDKEVHLVHGDAFIIPPRFIHSINFSSPDSEIYSLSFNENLFHANFSYSNVYKFLMALNPETLGEKKVDVRLKVLLDELQQENIYSLLNCLIRETTANYPQELSTTWILIAAILCILSQAYFSDPRNQTKFDKIESYSESIERCVEFIDQNFMQQITLSDLTKKFAMSKSTFTLLFSQITGIPFKHYLNRKRISQAQALVRLDNSLSFQEISKMVGYDDFSTFFRNFVKIAGVPPSQYKMEISKLQD